jgi:hypothetical protein
MSTRHDMAALVKLLDGRADLLNRCPYCLAPARFRHGRADGGHEVAGWLFEQPILTCPTAPAGRLISIHGDLLTMRVDKCGSPRERFSMGTGAPRLR